MLIEPGMEADDVIATLARRAEERGLDVFIVTADKDARQLISDQVRILNLRKNKIIDAAELEKEWGIRPDQVVDFLALTGDTVDNVPGVPGIGEGFAATFLKAIWHARQLLANISQVKGPKKQQSLREHADTARRARQLVSLRDDLPLELDWEVLKTQPPDVEIAEDRCAPNAAFTGFATSWAHDSRQLAAQGIGAELGRRPTTPSIRPSCSATFLDELKRQPRFCIDTETTAIDPLRADLVGLSFCWKSGEAYYLPVRGPAGSNLLDQAATLDGAAAHPGATPRSKRSARTSSTTCWRSGGRALAWKGRSPTR